jgi:hypothetical protein
MSRSYPSLGIIDGERPGAGPNPFGTSICLAGGTFKLADASDKKKMPYQHTGSSRGTSNLVVIGFLIGLLIGSMLRAVSEADPNSCRIRDVDDMAGRKRGIRRLWVHMLSNGLPLHDSGTTPDAAKLGPQRKLPNVLRKSICVF